MWYRIQDRLDRVVLPALCFGEFPTATEYGVALSTYELICATFPAEPSVVPGDWDRYWVAGEAVAPDSALAAVVA